MITSQQPRDVFEVERAIAKNVAIATDNFNPATIERLKVLAGIVIHPIQQGPQEPPESIAPEG